MKEKFAKIAKDLYKVKDELLEALKNGEHDQVEDNDVSILDIMNDIEELEMLRQVLTGELKMEEFKEL